MFEGPPESLILTENAQPALMTPFDGGSAGVGARGRVFAFADRAVLVAGHSLGEYTALAAAGSFATGAAARLLRLRGQAMQKAVPPGIGAMAALLGCEMPLALEICAEASADGEIVEAANDNGGGQVVISGHKTGGGSRDRDLQGEAA